ncbi:MAG TPA: hypothetical protein VHK69_20040 [Chitinophagaceae bacterium]|jgi:hypothetical protein|nr:hypothetical protein [Chitinophagaceae bacterium]
MDAMQHMEEQLWGYIDGTLTEDGHRTVEAFIREQAEWRSKYGELLEVHQLMQVAELEAPSLRFTKNVMEEVTRLSITPAARQYLNAHIIRGLGLFFVTLITGFFVYAFTLVEWTSGTGKSGLAINLEEVDYSPLFSSNLLMAFLMVNVIAGLFLFDRYLNARKNRQLGIRD